MNKVKRLNLLITEGLNLDMLITQRSNVYYGYN